MDREGTLHNLKARKTFIVRRSRDWPASREGGEDGNESRGSRVVQQRRVLDACLRFKLSCELIAASTVRASAVAQVRSCPIARFAYFCSQLPCHQLARAFFDHVLIFTTARSSKLLGALCQMTAHN